MAQTEKDFYEHLQKVSKEELIECLITARRDALEHIRICKKNIIHDCCVTGIAQSIPHVYEDLQAIAAKNVNK
uniref:Uncharacterized protein n=1 Tax=Panagrolaimus davidi TaxID=227884 RepID=A0A914Q9L9_9BILA